MKCILAIPLGVAPKKSDKSEDKIPAEYGQLLADAAAKLGLTDREVAKLAGYNPGPKTNDLTMHRLRTGEGSPRAAVRVYQALRDKGAKLPVPPMPGVDPPKPGPAWRDHWMTVGEVLHEYMNEQKFTELVLELRDQARAYERVSRGIAAISRPLPWDMPAVEPESVKRETKRGDGVTTGNRKSGTHAAR